MSDLLPCPFCGSTDVHTSPNGENYAYVYCNTCGAEGPTNDIGSVVMTWNRRAQPAQAVPLRQILTDPENQPNQYGVKFLMRGPKFAFKVGRQQFTLDYEPTESGEFEFMRDMLIQAFSTFTPDVKPAQAAPLLSDEEIQAAWVEHGLDDCAVEDFARAIEQEVRAKLGVRWIACADQMPPPDAWLLVAWGDGAVDKAHTFSKWKHPTNPLGYLIQGHPGSHNDVTHWQPLPPHPRIVSKEGGNVLE